MNTILEIKKLLKIYSAKKTQQTPRKTMNMYREFKKDDLKDAQKMKE